MEGGRAQISFQFLAVTLKSRHKAEEVADLAVHLPDEQMKGTQRGTRFSQSD